MKWLRKAADQGHAKAQATIGMLYYSEINYTEAAKWFRKAAENGLASAQYYMGYMLMYPNGMVGDQSHYAEATHWFQKSAVQGYPNAQTLLGEAYYFGYGVQRDLNLAKEWLGRACLNGVQRACDGYQKAMNEWIRNN